MSRSPLTGTGISLLDVNVLLSLLDSAHQHHAESVKWFQTKGVLQGWATCPLTENGFIRIITNPSYPNLRLTLATAADVLMQLKRNFAESHTFWPDDLTLADSSVFDLSILTSHRQTTDVYLAGLAHHHHGHLVTHDGKIAWKAVRGASSGLVTHLGMKAQP